MGPHDGRNDRVSWGPWFVNDGGSRSGQENPQQMTYVTSVAVVPQLSRAHHNSMALGPIFL